MVLELSWKATPAKGHNGQEACIHKLVGVKKRKRKKKKLKDL